MQKRPKKQRRHTESEAARLWRWAAVVVKGPLTRAREAVLGIRCATADAEARVNLALSNIDQATAAAAQIQKLAELHGKIQERDTLP